MSVYHALGGLVMSLDLLLVLDFDLLYDVFLFSVELLIHPHVRLLFNFDDMFHDIADLLGFLDLNSLDFNLFLHLLLLEFP